jgi:glycosyltransferase involved in cell wall biosynthesis
VHRLKHFVRANVLGRVTRKAKLIIVPSKLTATDLQNYLNVPLEKIKIVPPGIDLDSFKPAPVEHEGINIVCVARIAPNKGQDILLRAFRLVKKKYPNSRLYLVGGVSKDQRTYHRKLERIVEKLRIDDVVFAGHVSDEILANYHNLTDIYVQLLHLKDGEKVEVKAGYYNLADIYVQPSIGEEGWGITIVEAFACRKPVICTDIFSRIGVADNDRTLIVKSGDAEELAKAIELLIEDKELRKKIAENGYSFAQRLSWRETANDIVKALNNLVVN